MKKNICNIRHPELVSGSPSRRNYISPTYKVVSLHLEDFAMNPGSPLYPETIDIITDSEIEYYGEAE